MTDHAADRAAWADEQASHVRQRRHAGIDRENVARTIEQLGEADIEELREHVTVLLRVLIRWGYDVDFRSLGPYITIGRQRRHIAGLVEESPSLAPVVERLIVETYPEARRLAAIENGPFNDAFPAGLPFLPSEVLDRDFLPDPYGDDAILGPEWWRRP